MANFLLAAGGALPSPVRQSAGRRERSNMDNLKKGLGKYAADLALIAGAAAVAAGAGLIYPPAGLIAGGVLTILGAMLSILGGDKS